jgi:uncharacterized membrane protein YcaP (DUF421 family)
MRLADIASLQDVAWAVLEPGERISFIRGRDVVGAPPPDPGRRAG